MTVEFVGLQMIETKNGSAEVYLVDAPGHMPRLIVPVEAVDYGQAARLDFTEVLAGLDGEMYGTIDLAGCRGIAVQNSQWGQGSLQLGTLNHVPSMRNICNGPDSIRTSPPVTSRITLDRGNLAEGKIILANGAPLGFRFCSKNEESQGSGGYPMKTLAPSVRWTSNAGGEFTIATGRQNVPFKGDISVAISNLPRTPDPKDEHFKMYYDLLQKGRLVQDADRRRPIRGSVTEGGGTIKCFVAMLG